MKTIGIIGGIAPESTIEYYRLIITLYRQRKGNGSYPPIFINSIDLKRMLGLIDARKLAEVTALRDAAEKQIPFLDTTRIHVEQVVAQML